MTFVAFGVGAGSTWYFRETVFRLAFAPAGGNMSPYGMPVYTSPTEMLGVTIHVSVMGGAVAAFPVLMFNAFRLVNPWLNPQQRRFAVLFLPASLLCFVAGAAFAYFVMLPTGLRFLLHFGTGIAIPLIQISEYVSLVTALVFSLGVVFELPLAMFLLAKFRIVSHKRFRQLRKYVPVAALILSAIITPTFDVVNQLLVAVPIWVLYEVGLVGAWLAEGGHRTLWQRARPKVVWILWLLAVAFVVILWATVLAVVVWLALAGMDGKLNIEDWRRFVEDWGRLWRAVLRRTLE